MLTENEIMAKARKMEALRIEASKIERELHAELDNYIPVKKGDIANGAYGYGTERKDFSIERITRPIISVGVDVKVTWRIDGGIIKKDGTVSKSFSAATCVTRYFVEKGVENA